MLDFIIRLKDLATSPLGRISTSIDSTARRFDALDGTAQSSLRNISNGADKVASKFSGLGGVVAGALAATGIVAFGKSVLDTTVKYQKLEAVLATQMGSAKAGADALKMIQEIASKTPFAVDELTESFVKLKSQGFEPTRQQIIQLGDIAASMGKPFDQLAEAVLDAQSGEFERLKEFGIKAKQSGDNVTFTFKGVSTTVDKSSKSIQDYLVNLGNASGVQGSMAAIAATTGGAISNLGDQFDFLKKGLGEAFKPVIDKVIGVLGAFVSWLSKVGDWMKEHPKFVTGFSIALGIAAVAITALTVGVWAFNTAMWANPITWVVVAILALAAGIAYVIVMFDGWGKSINALWEIIKNFGTMAAIPFKMLWESITYYMEIGWLKIKDFFQWIEQKITNVGEALNKVKNFDFSGAFDDVNKKITTTASVEIEAKRADHEGKMKGFVSDMADGYKNITKQWENVGLTKAKDDPLAKIKDNLGLGGKPATPTPQGGTPKGLKDKANTIAGGGNRPTTINLTIHKLQDNIIIHTTNLKMAGKEAGEQIVEQLLTAINGANAALNVAS